MTDAIAALGRAVEAVAVSARRDPEVYRQRQTAAAAELLVYHLLLLDDRRAPHAIARTAALAARAAQRCRSAGVDVARLAIEAAGWLEALPSDEARADALRLREWAITMEHP